MKFLKTITLLMTWTFCAATHANIGCLDTSKHMKIWGDFKDLQPVVCNCPCGSDIFHRIITSKHNRCLHCRHYRFPHFYNPFVNVDMNRRGKKLIRMSLSDHLHPRGAALFQIFGS